MKLNFLYKFSIYKSSKDLYFDDDNVIDSVRGGGETGGRHDTNPPKKPKQLNLKILSETESSYQMSNTSRF